MPNLTKKFYYYLLGVLLYLSLIFGFTFNENLTGGAFNDYIAHREIIYKFSVNFIETFFHFDKENTRHSPFLLIILSYFKRIGFSDLAIRVINLHFLLLTIFFFYKCLKVKFNSYNSETLYLISLLLFLSPTFRSLTIWPDSRLYGIFFFFISRNNKYIFIIRSFFCNFNYSFNYSIFKKIK